MSIPRKINSNEVPGNTLWNEMVDHVRAITPQSTQNGILVRTTPGGTTFHEALNNPGVITELNGEIRNPGAVTYGLILRATMPSTIRWISLALGSGYCYSRLRINGVPVVGCDMMFVQTTTLTYTPTQPSTTERLVENAILTLNLFSLNNAKVLRFTVGLG